ncbi:MAG: zinc-dependent alcohol dehydrogenase family protein [Pseudomonadota bacterium]
MKQVRFSTFGDPETVVFCDNVPDPGLPGHDEVLVTIDAFPINPADLLTITGGYAVKPDLPATLGAEATGRIAALGAGVTGFRIGDRVIILARNNWCQQRRLPSTGVLKIDQSADVLQLAMLKVNPATAWMMMKNYVQLEPGDWLIQDAANSGVGLALAGLAGAEGVHTVNVVRRPEAMSVLRALSADVVLVDGDDLADRVAEATKGAAISLAIDAVGGLQVMRLADCLAEGGTVVNYGLLSGEPCQIRADQTIFKSVTLTGFWLQKALNSMQRSDIERLYQTLALHMAAKTLAVDVEATYSIDDIKDAVAHAGRDHRKGKILVLPNGDVAS